MIKSAYTGDSRTTGWRNEKKALELTKAAHTYSQSLHNFWKANPVDNYLLPVAERVADNIDINVSHVPDNEASILLQIDLEALCFKEILNQTQISESDHPSDSVFSQNETKIAVSSRSN